MMTAAVVFSGCGYLDGSEIHEAVSVLLHLSRAGVGVRCFAPDKPLETVDHRTQQATGESRNVLTESARIARGKIEPLTALSEREFDAVFFPGGFGAAKNLCDFAEKGSACHVEPEVERIIKAFHAARKPIGLCCIAPVLAAKVLPGVKVTLGDDAGVAGAIHAMGSRHENHAVHEAAVDTDFRVATAPAYMYGEAPIHEVYLGIGHMVEETLKMARTS